MSEKIRNVILKTGEDGKDYPTDQVYANNQMIGTNFLRSTGLLDAYEHVVASMVEEGWPAEKSIFDHAAYLLLKWQGEN